MSRRFVITRISLQATLLATLALWVSSASAQIPPDEVPLELQGVGVNERLDELIPLDIEFTDQNGKKVRLGDYFDQGKPVILTPIFYECPMLCSLVLNGLIDGLKELEWTAGEEFEIVTFSFNHREQPKLAEVKRRAYLGLYGRETGAEGWPFLTGDIDDIKKLTNALGFAFRYDQKQETYAHTASIMFITPDGKISRYMDDVLFQSKDLKLALVEASEGRIGSPLEKFALFMCYTYDPSSNSYVADARKIMKFGGVVTIFAIVAGFIFLSWRRTKTDPKKETIIIGGMQT